MSWRLERLTDRVSVLAGRGVPGGQLLARLDQHPPSRVGR